jgi:WD40 repeat protein
MAVREPPDELLRAMSSRPRPIIVVGAGVTRSQVGSWTELLCHAVQFAEDRGLDRDRAAALSARAIKSGSAEDLIAVATEVEHVLKGEEGHGQFGAWLQAKFGDAYEPGPLVRAVVRVGRRFDAALATTNYDSLLHPGGSTMTWREPDRLLALFRGDLRSPGYPSAVAHLHGYWEQPDSVIFGDADYERHAADKYVPTLNEVISLGHTLVFIGCGDGLHDPNWARLLRRMQEFKARHSHFRLCRARDVGHVPPVVRNVVYGDDYEDLMPFLDALAKRGPLRQPPRRAPRLLAECGDQVALVAITPNADTLATAGADRFLRVWERQSGNDAEAFRELQKLPMANLATCALFHPGADGLAIGTRGGVDFYRRSDGTWESTGESGFARDTAGLTSIGNGRWLAFFAADLHGYPAMCCGTPEQLRFSLAQASPPHLSFFSAPVEVVAFADERWFASASIDGVTRLWCLSGAEPLGCVGEWKARGASDRLVQLWESDRGGDGPRLGIAASAERLAVGYQDGRVHVYDTTWLTALGKELSRVATRVRWGSTPDVQIGDRCDVQHGAAVTALSMSANGETLVTAGADGAIRVWAIATRDDATELCSLDGHGVVRSMAVTPDGHTLATAGGDGLARIWDLRP